ncbi:DNA mismatch endonuclease Vsr [Bifidobacterium sp. 82T10]|uniref:DNA mismatch endonuclease Vsr n=1 Tax=Bifidobacterium miconis TaxID=2834435 RepID=A0ABS6WFQ4_9BIFI|nr:very short patch repair endonuclease [Bifidobacterium miconis]MBW3092888.1 DNA mismatch endonuclease Vsr [Bifidobacterium miconis]
MVAGKPVRQEKYARGTRSYTMSRIRSKNTKIEVLVRSYLFRRGLRFRKNDRRYPGHPDVVLPKYHAVVFVNGCFWHMHDGCAKHSMPKSNVEFWSAKLARNHDRDIRQHAELRAAGWRVIVVWECELAKATREARLERLYREIVGGTEDARADAGADEVDTVDDGAEATSAGDVAGNDADDDAESSRNDGTAGERTDCRR